MLEIEANHSSSQLEVAGTNAFKSDGGGVLCGGVSKEDLSETVRSNFPDLPVPAQLQE